MRIHEKRRVGLRGTMTSCKPRILFQILFDEYRELGGSLSNLDNLLIDYENGKERFSSKEYFAFFWGMVPGAWITRWIDAQRVSESNPDSTLSMSMCEVFIHCKIKTNEIIVSNVEIEG